MDIRRQDSADQGGAWLIVGGAALLLLLLLLPGRSGNPATPPAPPSGARQGPPVSIGLAGHAQSLVMQGVPMSLADIVAYYKANAYDYAQVTYHDGPGYLVKDVMAALKSAGVTGVVWDANKLVALDTW